MRWQPARPAELLRVSIVERDAQSANRLRALLNAILPTGIVSDHQSRRDAQPASLGAARISLGTVGHDSREKPHVFVAMPFADDYADRFHYGIQGAANAAGYLCERADLASFTGDVIAWVKDRIGRAALVVADLTSATRTCTSRLAMPGGAGSRRCWWLSKAMTEVRRQVTKVPDLSQHSSSGRASDRRTEGAQVRPDRVMASLDRTMEPRSKAIDIRAEEPEDIPFIRRVHQRAFHPSPIEAELVDLLRQRHKMPQSWVAIAHGGVVGHVAFSAITLVPDHPAIGGLGLAPVGVLPEFQRQGIGEKLIVQGLAACKQSGCDVVVVLGDPRYYARFGFEDARRHQLENEYHAEEEFMVLELRPGALRDVRGLVKYQPEFTEVGAER